jgi:glutamyl-tRNA synthetase
VLDTLPDPSGSHAEADGAHPRFDPAPRSTEPTGADVRVRFCPSPTGTPHVGLVRTALFNWAYARHVGGTFVFRMEDTDSVRDSQESYEQLLEALRWLGLDWDEGVEVGGPHAPYRQSERLEIYADVAQRLLDAGYAYESFSTPEEIEARHREAGRDPKLGYDGFDRDMDEAHRAALRAQGREPVLRVRMPDDAVTFTDLVRGELTFAAGSVPDFVIVRANGLPLYTLTNPVDDALMGITHVLRGEDLLSSTPRQVVLFRALTALGLASAEPVYGHLPYVMGEGNKKLSKRDPESSLFHLRDLGFLPEGLVNYLALLGWGIGPDRDVFTREELVAAFDVHDVTRTPPGSTSRRRRRSTPSTCGCCRPTCSPPASCRTCTAPGWSPRPTCTPSCRASGPSWTSRRRSCRRGSLCSGRRPGCSASSSCPTWSS